MKNQRLHKLIQAASHLFFPPVCPCCGRSIGKQEIFCPKCLGHIHRVHPGEVCPRCSKSICTCIRLTPCFSLVYPASFYDGSIPTAIHNMKFRRHPGHARLLGKLLTDTLRAYQVGPADFDLLAAVPMSRRKLRARGYNQAALLAAAVARQTGIPFAPKALTKTRETRAQHQLSAMLRRTNLKGSFQADPSVNGKRVLLVDDVLTTGTTANEAAEILLSAGAKRVDVLVLATTRSQIL